MKITDFYLITGRGFYEFGKSVEAFLQNIVCIVINKCMKFNLWTFLLSWKGHFKLFEVFVAAINKLNRISIYFLAFLGAAAFLAADFFTAGFLAAGAFLSAAFLTMLLAFELLLVSSQLSWQLVWLSFQSISWQLASLFWWGWPLLSWLLMLLVS